VVPQHPVTRAKYPFIDVHNHSRGASSRSASTSCFDMDALNLRVMVDLSGGYGEKLKRTVEAQKGRHKDRLVVFANIDFKDLDASDTPPAPRRNWKRCQERRAGPEILRTSHGPQRQQSQRVHSTMRASIRYSRSAPG